MRQPLASSVPFLLSLALFFGCSPRSSQDENTTAGQGGVPTQAVAEGGAPSAGSAGSEEWATWGGAAGHAASSGSGGQGASAGDTGQGAGGSKPEVKTMGCTGIPKPDTIPDDWIEYTGWSCECPVYFAGKSAHPPPRVEWQSCTFSLPNGIVCQQLKPPAGKGASVRLGLRGPDGPPMLQIKVDAGSYSPGAYRFIVAEVDGTPHVDVLTVAPSGGCMWTTQAVADDRYLFRILRDTWKGAGDPFNEGFVAGSIHDAIPTKVMKYEGAMNLNANWFMSADWIVQLQYKTTAFPWGEGVPQTVYSAADDPNNLPGHQTFVVGKNVFVEAGGQTKRAVSVWSPAQGQRQLIGWPNDKTQSAGNFGTDGKDMVWTYASGTVTSGEWSNLTVMTAPYSTDPAEVTKTQRVLRKDHKTFDGGSWAVGCGYAARGESTNEFGNGLVVVRLADGVGWIIAGDKIGPTLSAGFGKALGITCEHIYTQMSLPEGGGTAIRIPLSSLGPGLPPD